HESRIEFDRRGVVRGIGTSDLASTSRFRLLGSIIGVVKCNLAALEIELAQPEHGIWCVGGGRWILSDEALEKPDGLFSCALLRHILSLKLSRVALIEIPALVKR